MGGRREGAVWASRWTGLFKCLLAVCGLANQRLGSGSRQQTRCETKFNRTWHFDLSRPVRGTLWPNRPTTRAPGHLIYLLNKRKAFRVRDTSNSASKASAQAARDSLSLTPVVSQYTAQCLYEMSSILCRGLAVQLVYRLGAVMSWQPHGMAMS